MGAAESYTFSGTIKTSGTTAALTNVLYVLGDCYLSGGTAALTKGVVTESIASETTTSTTGQVSVQTGKRTTLSTLPAYGNCPGEGRSTGRDAGRR